MRDDAKRTQPIEPLEGRTLLAGVTLLAHGYNGDINGWVGSLANAIVARAGGSSKASVYTMTVDVNSSNNLAVTSFSRNSGFQDYQGTGGGEVVIQLDWSEVSGGDYSTGEVANVVSNYLTARRGGAAPFSELPIHLIGHSRGASLITALSKRLGERGIWVDQLTGLDPHPVDGENDFFNADFGDTPMNSFANVVYSESYWRSNGNSSSIDFNGEPIPGAYNLNLRTVEANHFVSAHGAVPSYYHGTADLNATSNGEHPVISGWYGTTSDKPRRNATGFYYSHLVGGTQPASGVGRNFGGTGARASVSTSGAQAPNVAQVRLGNGSSFVAGKSVRLNYRYGDRDSSAKVVWSIDRDTNPYNGNFVRTGARSTFARTADPKAASINVGTSGVATGTYYLVASVVDSTGLTRYNYANRAVSISAAPGVATLTAPAPARPSMMSMSTRAEDVWAQLDVG